MTSRKPASGLLISLLLLSFAADCGQESGQREPRVPAGTPVVLISIDTLRADRLPAYGYDRVETPAIDALRADSILYERAYSHVPLTLPSHASVLTGLLPTEHGVRDNLGVEIGSLDDLPFLPLELKEAGYSTGAMVSTYVLQGKTGLGAGFDVYDDTVDRISKNVRLQRSGEETLEPTKEWLDTVADSPFFLFFHIYDPHTPHEPIEPWASRFAVPYDAEVAYSDHVVGGLLAHLRDLDLYDRTLIVLLSDHGESLGDHGEYEHGIFLYNSTQRVPLLLKLPGSQRANTTVGRLVGLVDIFPTILDCLGITVPEPVQGISLLSESADPERNLYAEAFYARAHLGWSELTSLIGPRYQLIDAPRPELYDLLEDPNQRNNLIQTERRVAAELRRELEQYDRTYDPAENVDDETRARLAALGYVGTIGDVGDGPLPDPKDKTEILSLLKESNARFQEKDFEGAVAGLEKVIESEPKMVDARDLMAKALLRSGRPEEALAAYQEALKIATGNPTRLVLATAQVLMGLKRLEEARQHTSLVPDDLEAVHMLGEIAVLQGDLEAAERSLVRAGELDSPPLPQMKLESSIALARGEYQRAIDLTVEAERLLDDYTNKTHLKGVYLTRGKAQVQLGLLDEAETSFLSEIDVDPEQLQPHAHLALLYAVQNRGPETGRALQRMVETNPTPLAYAEAVRTLRFIGDSRSATALLQQALSRWPDSSSLRQLTGG